MHKTFDESTLPDRERETLRIVRDMLKDYIKPERLFARYNAEANWFESYFEILLDNDIEKIICRLVVDKPTLLIPDKNIGFNRFYRFNLMQPVRPNIEKALIETVKRYAIEFKNCLVLDQYRNDSEYNDFIGKYYHFPGNKSKSYLEQFKKLPIEFIYYEPSKEGKGEYFGYGKILKPPFPDKREEGYYFAEIDGYKQFATPVAYKDENGVSIEKQHNPHYNSQNAVRKIPYELMQEICLDGNILLNFEADTHVIQILGEQLIASEKVGIMELIKNSIDAQASYCRVRIERNSDWDPSLQEDEYPDLPGPVIIIEDDGVGMTREDIEMGWLKPASKRKINIKQHLKEERDLIAKSETPHNMGTYEVLLERLKKQFGRIPLGEKGVGRFAANRLGRYLELRTKTKELPYELVLKIDWQQFDTTSSGFTNLSSVGITLTREKPTRNYGEKQSGTKLIIYGGKPGFKLNKKDIEDLFHLISNINSPAFQNASNVFKATLECPQFKYDSYKISPIEESIPNFIFDGFVNENGILEKSELKFKHPRDLLPPIEWHDDNTDLRLIDDNDKEYWFESSKKRSPECGEFKIQMKIWYRTSKWIDLADFRKMTEYLDNYGGLSLYRDGILIQDAKLGSEYDWLGLTGKHIKQGGRISYRDFIGSVEITSDNNFELIDKTNREGLISNQASKDLKILLVNIIEKIIFLRYKKKRDEFSNLTKGIITEPKTLGRLAKQSSQIFNNISKSEYVEGADPYNFFKDLWDKVEERKQGVVNLSNSFKELQKSFKMMQEVQDMFVEQAGFGIAVAISLHEINKITTNFYYGISNLIKSGDFNKIKLEELKETSLSLTSELKRLSPLRAIRNEKNRTFNILTALKYASEVYIGKLREENIQFNIVNPDEDFKLFGKQSTITQVFGNLFDNSIYWIKYSDNDKKAITIMLNKKYRTIIFADSGSDISDVIRPSLFQPGYSLKIPPSGLGLYICKTYLNNLKAQIYETPAKDRLKELPGAQFTLDFNKTPEDRNV